VNPLDPGALSFWYLLVEYIFPEVEWLQGVVIVSATDFLFSSIFRLPLPCDRDDHFQL